jgi:hypothetical protein
MANNIVNNYCSSMVQFFQEVTKTYENNIEVIKTAEGELTDIEHEIELSNPKNACDGYKLYKELREIRVRRRTAKNENQLLQEIYDYFTSPQGQAFKNKIQQIQGSSRKIHDAQQKRVYTPRQRTDLTITDRTCETKPSFEKMLADFNQNKVTMKNGKMRK